MEEDIAMAKEQSELSDHLKIEVFQEDWAPGFAAFGEGSVEHQGHAHVVLNLGALMSTVANKDVEPADIPYMVAETIMHEVVHALEEWAGVEFSEERVEALVQAYREKYRDEEPRPNPAEEFNRTLGEMDKAVMCLFAQVPERVAEDVKSKWQAVKAMLGMDDG